MVEPGREHRRGPAVVLGRPEHDDRAGRPRLVAAALVPDPVRREGTRRRSAPTTARPTMRDVAVACCVERRPGSPPVALLVLLARAAPARVVAADALARTACSRPLAPPAAAPSPTTRSPSWACIWRAVAAPGRPRATGPVGSGGGRRGSGCRGPRSRRRCRRPRPLRAGWPGPGSGTGSSDGGGLAGHGDPEDRGRDAVADQRRGAPRTAGTPRGGTR